MTAHPGSGSLLRGGRLVARVLVVWVLAVVALRLLDDVLAGFAMPEWWQPIVSRRRCASGGPTCGRG
jgi:hypothetical protein